MSKQDLVDAVIKALKKDLEQGDETVLDELLLQCPTMALLESLPEDQWYKFSHLQKEESN